jgi:hypothetical protein
VLILAHQIPMTTIKKIVEKIVSLGYKGPAIVKILDQEEPGSRLLF